MGRDYSNYLQFLALEHNILYIGKDSHAIYNSISDYFASASKIDINQEILEKLNAILTKRHIDIVVFDVKDNNPLIIEFFHAIKKFNDEIMTMLLFEPKEYHKLFDMVPFVDINVSYPISTKMFEKKLFTLLSRSYALNSIGRREIILKQKCVTEDSIDKFFDTYEGSALFLADDLMEIVKNLNDGNLSYKFFINIAHKLDEVADIFSKTQQTQSVTPIYEDLASYLKTLDLETIEPKNLSAFSYLADILSDVSVYLMDMFVDRIFKDVFIFEHSLKSNIEFMKSHLNGEQENEGEIDFF